MKVNKFRLGHVWDCTEVFKQKVWRLLENRRLKLEDI